MNLTSRLPFGLHWTQSAARLSLRITRVGTHSPPSKLHTYLQEFQIQFKRTITRVNNQKIATYEFLSWETVTILLDFELQSIPETIWSCCKQFKQNSSSCCKKKNACSFVFRFTFSRTCNLSHWSWSCDDL